MKEIEKYIKDGITITGNPEKGYRVFTIPTQHFDIKTLEELTSDKFEHEIEMQRSYEESSNEISSSIPLIDLKEFLKGY